MVKAAPSAVSGTIAASVSSQATNGTQVAYYSPVGIAAVTTYPATARYNVYGTVTAKADYITVATPSSWISHQAADTTTNTAASFTVVSKPLTGTVLFDYTASGAATSAFCRTLAIANSNGDTLTSSSGPSCGSNTSVVSTGTSLANTLNGATATVG